MTSAAPLNLMACVRESSPQELAPTTDLSRHESKRRRFHPFRGLRRMFRRKARQSGSELQDAPEDMPEGSPVLVIESHRSRSTSELLAGEEPIRRRSGTGLFASHQGLSVSHDSVFTAEHRSSQSSCEDLDIGQSSSSLSIQQLVLPGVRAELFDAVRKRRGREDTSEEDEDLGLPRSPCNSPTTADVLLEKDLKENATKSHSTCSDGSLLSMGSSDMDEDSLGLNSGHSSKLSLSEKKSSFDNDSDLEVISAAPLSHSAAKHKMSVKPKRTHGAPRRRKNQQLAAPSPLPATPEVNEDLTNGRNSSPHDKSDELAASDDATAYKAPPSSVTKTDVFSTPLHKVLPTDIQLKSASLPHGPVSSQQDKITKLGRSQSSAASNKRSIEIPHYERSLSESEKVTNLEQVGKSNETFATVGEEDEKHDNSVKFDEDKDDKRKDDSSFFGRLLLRKSGKKKKEKFDETDHDEISEEHNWAPEEPPVIPKRIIGKDYYTNDRVTHYLPTVPSQMLSVKHFIPKAAVPGRSTAALRQRVEPINIPASPETERRIENVENSTSTSYPKGKIQGERLPAFDVSIRNTHITHSTSPPKPMWPASLNKSLNERFSSQDSQEKVDVISKSVNESVPLKPVADTFISEPTQSVLPKEEPKPNPRNVSVSTVQNDTNTITDIETEERECSSLTYMANDDVISTRQSVKKAYSFREEQNVTVSIPERRISAPRLENFSEKEEADILEGIILKPLSRSSVDETNRKDIGYKGDKAQENNRLMSDHQADENDVDNVSIGQESKAKPADTQGRLFTKHVSRNFSSKDLGYNSKLLDNNIAKAKNSKTSMKKSSSLDSINSFGDRPLSPVGSRKSLSSESISSSTKELTDVSDSSMFQNVPLEHETSTRTNIDFDDINLGLNDEKSNNSVTYLSSTVDTTVTDSNTVKSSFLPSKVPQDKRTSPTWSSTSPVTSESPDIPEFLRVQLNRVDSRTSNVVLSTSVIFDSGKSKSKSPETFMRNQQDLSDVNINPVFESNKLSNPENRISSTIPTDIDVKIKISNRVSQGSDASEESNTVNNVSSAHNRSSIINTEKTETKNSQNIPEKKCSVVSITATEPLVTAKSEVSTFSMEEARKKLKKQSSTEYKDIKIVEKSPLPETRGSRISLPARKHSMNEKVTYCENKRQSLQHEFPSLVEPSNSTEGPLVRKPGSKEIIPKSEENKSGAQIEKEINSTNDAVSYTNVVFRKKSLPKEVDKPKDEEPELLKVFARRSLKLKDVDSEQLSQQITSKSFESQSSEQESTKSRDSDKENECADSPCEERKKSFSRETSVDLKGEQLDNITDFSSVNLTSNNAVLSNKYHRSHSNSSDNSIENETNNILNRKDGRTTPEKIRNQNSQDVTKNDSVPNNEKVVRKPWLNNWKEKKHELTNGENVKCNKIETNIIKEKDLKAKEPVVPNVISDEPEEPVPHFKRIQQRREEWEKRAQQASKRIYS